MTTEQEVFRFSGHETFPCRYAWLPKAFSALKRNDRLFADEEEAMIALGVGKNMVRAIRFWVDAIGVARPVKGGGAHEITDFGETIFAPGASDPFLEDVRTLWLIHWQLATNVQQPLFAWHYLLNQWQHPEIGRHLVLQAFAKEAVRLDRDLSRVTLEQHFDTFLHSYVPTRSRKGEVQEDNLDCPLVELELIQKVGERKLESGGREMIYAFRREEKPEITPGLFAYCVGDFWEKCRSMEQTLSFRDVSVAPGSPGQVFKLPEADVRQRLETIEEDSGGQFSYRESASLQQLSRVKGGRRLLSSVYGEVVHA
jgi:Protein of unknown function (DUF4007)